MTTRLGSIFAITPWWFLLVASLISLYHGWRGYVLQRAFAHDQHAEMGATSQLSPVQTLLARPAYDGFFSVLCSVAGFAALRLAGYLFNTLPSIYDIPGGTSAVLVFLIVLGLLGVSGQLPFVIQLGTFPR